MERISENAVATASRGSFSFGAALRLQLMRTNRSAEPYCSRWEIEAVDALPVGVDRELLGEARRVGHHRIFAVVVDDEPAGYKFEDRAVARRVCEREMAACLLSAGQVRRNHGERTLAERVDRFGDVAVIIEDALGPGADRDQRLA
jgi:hypothetical protein